jgi:hypothetical protein
MGLNRFADMLKGELNARFSKAEVLIWGDPAGMQRDQIFETTAFDHLKSLGMLARPTATNEFRTRREAMAIPMGRLIEGKPGFLVSKKCVRLRKALAGGYHFKRVSMGSGQERFRDVPNKNEHSHVGDAAGYCCLGSEHRIMTKGPRSMGMQTQTAKVLDFDVYS